MSHTPDLLLKGGVVLDPESGHTKKVDVRIKDGIIADVGSNLDANGTPVYDCTDKYISPGWMDMHVHLREPGFEHKETIESGCKAAAFGGFTAVACMPNTNPPIHTRDVVEFIKKRAAGNIVDVYPIACVSKMREGKELTEMADLVEGGAVAFSDDGSPVQDAGLMRRALEYSSMLGVPIINHMEEETLNTDGHMFEGDVSTRLGIPGIPCLAEEVMIARDILLAGFTGGHVHVAHISTKGAVDLVREAKAKGISITAEVCTHHFTLTDEAVEAHTFSTNTKMHPPLADKDSVAAIKEGLRDDTIDVICTDHAPHASFEKEVEFIEAPFGILGLETAWGLTGRELIDPGILSVEKAVRKLTVEPYRVLKLELPRIEKGKSANLTVFDASTQWVFKEEHIQSKSNNTPFVNDELIGRAWAIYNKGQFYSI
ncbi:MAG: dihydroorotase [Rhodothermaceae bacterium]|nr:dihydroorotase [Rhodothermaceae bacterium]